MPQFNVQFKDGSEYLVDAPEDATTEDLVRLINDRSMPSEEIVGRQFDRIADARMAGIDRLLEARRAREEEDEGVIGNLIEGFGAGFVGMGESAALGAATLLEEEDELAARETIQSFADSITDDEGDEDSISYGLGQALGSIAGIAAPAALAGFVAPASAATAVGTGVAALLGAGAGTGEASERARAAGATEEERGAASFRGALIGLTEILPIARFVKYVDVPVVSNLVDKLGPEAVEGIGSRIRNMAVTGGAEGLQEATAEILQNINEQQYNALAETFEGIGPAAGYGGGAGAIIQGLIDIFVPGKSRKETGDPNDTTVGEALTDQIDVEEEQRLQREASERLGDPQQDMFALEKEQLLERGFEEPVAEEVTEEVEQETSPAQMDLVDEAEFQELVEEEATAEQAAIEQEAIEQEEADAQAQAVRAESELESITARETDRRQAESEARRGEILRNVIEETPTRQRDTLVKRFTSALEAEGITNLQPTEAEFSTIQRAIDFQRAERVEPEMLPSDSDVTEMEAAVAPRERTEITEQPSFPGMGRAGLTATPTVDEDVEVAQEPTPVTSEVMDGLGISKNALIRKRIEGKDLNDPVVRDDLIAFARKSKSQDVKQNVDRLLSGVPDEQLSLIPTKQETKRLKESIKPKKDDSSFSGTIPLKHGSSESDLTAFIDPKDVNPEVRYAEGQEPGVFGNDVLYMGYPDNPFLKTAEELDMIGFDPLPFIYDVEATFEKAFVLTPQTAGEFKKLIKGAERFKLDGHINKLKEQGYDGLIIKDMDALTYEEFRKLNIGKDYSQDQIVAFDPIKQKIVGKPTEQKGFNRLEAVEQRKKADAEFDADPEAQQRLLDRYQKNFKETEARIERANANQLSQGKSQEEIDAMPEFIAAKKELRKLYNTMVEQAQRMGDIQPTAVNRDQKTVGEAIEEAFTDDAPASPIERKLAKFKEKETPPKQVAKKKTTAKRVTTKKTTETKQRTKNITAKPKAKPRSPKKLTAKQQAEATLQLMQKYKDVEGMKVAEDQKIIELRDDGYFDPKYLGFEAVQDGGFRITFLMDGIPSDATGTSPLTQEDTAKIDTIKNTEKVAKDSLMESLQGFFGSSTNPKVDPLSALYWAIFEDVFHARKYTEGKKKGQFVYPQQFNSKGESEATKKFFKATGRKRARKVLEWANENMSPKTKQWMENVRRELQAQEAKTELSLVASDKADLRRQKASEQDKSIAAAEKTPKAERTDRSNEKLRQDLSNFNTIRDTQVGEAKDISIIDYMLGKVYGGEPLPIPKAIVSALSERFHPVTMALVTDGNLKEALESISTSSSNQKVRDIARKLSEFAGNTKIQIAPDLDMAGQFDPKTNTVFIHPTSGTNTHVIFHEVTHALTSATLANKNHPLTKRLNKLFNEVKDSLDTAYGATTLDEFAAEAFSNPDFQKKLARILLKDGKPATGTNALTRFYNIVARFLSNKLGLNFKTYDDALTESNKIILEILSPAPDSRDAGILAMDTSRPRIKELEKRIGDITRSFNPMDKAGREEFGNLARDFLDGKLAENVRGWFMGVLPSQALADVARVFGITGMQDLHVAMEEQRGDLTKVDDGMDANLIKIKQWLDKQSESVKDLFNEVVYDSTIEQVDPSKPRSSYVVAEEIALDKEARRIQNSVFKKTKQEISLEEARNQIPQEKLDSIKEQAAIDDAAKLAEWDKLNKKYKKLGKGGQDTYKFMRDVYKDIYAQLKDVMGTRVDELPLPEDAKKKLKKEVFDRLFEKGEIDPYFPLTRSGDYWLSYTFEGEHVVEAFESPTARRHAIELLEKETGIDKSSIQEFVNVANFDFTKTPATSFISQTLQTLKSNNVPPEVMEEITRLFLETLPESSFAKSLQSRKKVTGYKENALDAMQKKGYDLARQVARLRNTEKINRVMDNIEEEIKGSKIGTSVNGKALLEEIRKRADFARNPPKDGAAQALNRLAFFYTIGLNASSALVNLSQIPLFVAPMFGAKYGYKETTVALGEAMRLGQASIGKSRKLRLTAAYGDSGVISVDKDRTMPAIDNYYEWDADNNFVLRKDIDIPDNLRKELEELRPLVEMATERGQLNRSLVADSLGIDTSGRTKSFWDKVNNLSAFMFHQAEQVNRQTTMIAAYKLELQQINEKAKDSKNPESKMTTAEKQQLASTNALYATQETNGGAVLETGPRFSQQGFLRVAMMYKNFGIQMYYTMWKSAITGLNSGAFTKEERIVAAKQLMGVHGTALLFAGVGGVPIFGAVAMLANMLPWWDDDEEGEVDFETYVRNYIGEEWYKGGLTTLFDIDVSQRVALTNLLFSTNRYDRDPSTADTLLHYFGGPAYSVVDRALDLGMKDLADGNIQRGIESFVPSAVRNFYRGAYRYVDEGGMYTRRGDPIVTDYGIGDALPVVLGFPPVEYMRKSEFNSIRKNIDTAAAARRTKILRRYYVALRHGDLEGAREAREEMGEFNRQFPSNAISPETIRRSLKGHIKTSVEMHDGVLLSKNMRSALLDIQPKTLNLWDD